MPPPNLTAACFLKVDEKHPKSGTPFNAFGPRTYTRVFTVEMDHQNWGVLEVSLAPGLPTAFSPYANVYTGFWDGLALLTTATCDRVTDHDRVWEVTCNYTTEIPRGGIPASVGLPVGNKPGQQGGGSENNPDMEPPEVEFEFEEVNVPAKRDLQGKAFVNSAWESFTPTPTIPYQRPIYTMTRNELFFNIELAGLVAGTTNDAEFNGYPKDSVLCMAPKAKVMYKGGFRYVRTTYRFKFGYVKENGEYESFQHVELDQGYRERIPVVYEDTGNPVFEDEFPDQQAQEYVPIMNGSAKASKPTMLNGKGRKQKEYEGYAFEKFVEWQEGPETGATIYQLKPYYLYFKTRRRINFDALWKKGFGVKNTKKFVGDPAFGTNPPFPFATT